MWIPALNTALRLRIERMAEHGQGTFPTFGVPGGAAVTSEEYDPVTEIAAFLRRKDRPELLLHLFRLLALGKPQSSADPDAVGVADYAARNTVQVAQQEIGSLASHTGDSQQFLHGTGYLAAVVPQQHLAAQNDIPGFMLVEAAGMHQLLHMADVSPGHSFQRGIGGKEGRSHQIYPGIGTLGRKSHSDHQLIVLFIVESAGRVTVALFQNINDGCYLLRHNQPLRFTVLFLLYHEIRRKATKIAADRAAAMVQISFGGTWADRAEIS